MSMLLDRRNDGSLALFLDGDLQFDSRDEHIYHECLALPALAIAEARGVQSIHALIIGGGDGLTARELLKSKRIGRLELVDYDSQILQLAGNELAGLNQNSLADARTHISIEDAREFVKHAVEAGTRYDVIISDLTAPHDAEAAQLHSLEFYDSLRCLLGARGVLAVNTASPTGTPEAYWSIFNSMLSSSLNPRPYRIVLTSFAEQGYGSDWGFILGSPQAITAEALGDDLVLAEPRKFLQNGKDVRKLFVFPQAVFERQSMAAPGSGKSGILVHYLFNPQAIESASDLQVDTLSIDLAEVKAPQPESISYLLPEEMRRTLSTSQWQDTPDAQEALVQRVFELMPTLQRFQSREMISAFLSKPAAFLAPINLAELVNELMERASELPDKLVEELDLLKRHLVEFGQDYGRLLSLGLRSLAIICLVVIMGNLMYPDSVYAKDGASHSTAGAHGLTESKRGERGGRGRRGGVYGGDGIYGGGVYSGDTVINKRVIKRPVIEKEVIEPQP